MNNLKKIEKLSSLFDPELFRNQGHKIVDILADYLKDLKDDKVKTVLPNIDPETMMNLWTGKFDINGDDNWENDLRQLLKQSNHLHHPKYIGHQVSAPLPFSSLMAMVSGLLNNGSAVYEMGPVNVIMERKIIQWMAGLIGYNENADGVITSGGTLGNLTALLAARQKMFNSNVWKEGVFKEKNNCIMVSSQSHYSVNRAASIMGLGEESTFMVPVNSEFRMDISEIKKIYNKLRLEGKTVFALVGNGCSTSTGTYDNLGQIADFCKKNNIWFHIDGAHGASILLSEKYRGVMTGVEKADSIVWDAHKMMMMPALITAVIFKDGNSSYEAFSQKASYLFERTSREEWYNYAHRTMECTKKMLGLQLYLSLKNFGTKIFTDHVEYTHELSIRFAEIIDNKNDFELATKPQSNIVCFRYIKDNLDKEQLNQLQKNIKKEILRSEKVYIVQTELNGKLWLRCTVMNSLTKIEDLNDLLDQIIDLGARL